LRADALSPEERNLLLALARVVLQPAQGGLAEQLKRPDGAPDGAAGPVRSVMREGTAAGASPVPASEPSGEFFNGLGSFSAAGSEYVIGLEPGKTTPPGLLLMTDIGVPPNIIELSASTVALIFSVIMRWTSENASVPPWAIRIHSHSRHWRQASRHGSSVLQPISARMST